MRWLGRLPTRRLLSDITTRHRISPIGCIPALTLVTEHCQFCESIALNCVWNGDSCGYCEGNGGRRLVQQGMITREHWNGCAVYHQPSRGWLKIDFMFRSSGWLIGRS